MNTREVILFGIVSVLLAFILITSWLGFLRAGSVAESNPAARAIFDYLWSVTGNLTFSILIFVPITVIGVYFAARAVKKEYQRKYNYPKAAEVLLIAFIVLLIPNVLYNARFAWMEYRLMVFISIVPAALYVAWEWYRWKWLKSK